MTVRPSKEQNDVFRISDLFRINLYDRTQTDAPARNIIFILSLTKPCNGVEAEVGVVDSAVALAVSVPISVD